MYLMETKTPRLEDGQSREPWWGLPPRGRGCSMSLALLLGLLTLNGGWTAGAAPLRAQEAGRIPVPPMSGGIQVNEPDHDRWVASVASAGLDAVQVTLYARQQVWDGSDLWFDREASPRFALRSAPACESSS